MEAKDQINVYRCRECGGETVTVNLAAGVTPMFIRCRAGSALSPCPGMAASAGYQVPQTLVPDYGWYSPDDRERQRLEPATLDHVQSGGLLLRKLDNLERERYGARFRSDGS